MPNTYACKGVFNPIFLPNSAEGMYYNPDNAAATKIAFLVSSLEVQ